MSGKYLRRAPPPEPRHFCEMPKRDESESGDVWQCECGRVYIWSTGGYGFEWKRVHLRKWWFEFLYGMGGEKEDSDV